MTTLQNSQYSLYNSDNYKPTISSSIEEIQHTYNLIIAEYGKLNKMNTNIPVNTPSNSSTESKIQLDSYFINTDITSSDLEQKELISTIQSDIPIETNDNSARDFFPKLYNDVRI